MKTMTCAQMGGMCDTALSAETEHEMKQQGMAHLEVAHPEMAAGVKAMPEDAPEMVAWGQKFSADWEAHPEDA